MNRHPVECWLAAVNAHGAARAAAGFARQVVLLSAPSIVMELIVCTVMVAPKGHFSGTAGAISLAVLVIPIVIRTGA